jgi:cyanophycin synthetase
MSDLEIRKIHILRGPNVWSNHPVLEAWVGLGSLSGTSSGEFPGFSTRLDSWLPGGIGHFCGEGASGGGLGLDDDSSPAQLLARVTLELQALAGHRETCAHVRQVVAADLYQVVVGYAEASVAVACLHGARDLLLAAYRAEPFEVEAAIERLRDVVDSDALGPSTKAIVEAAKARGIPCRRLQEGRSLVQLGHGVKQRRMWTAETERSGAIAEYIAKDKDLARMILRQAGVPVPTGRIAVDADDAWEAAQDIGLPVVIKPRDGNHGRGVFIDMQTREQISDVFPHAAKCGDGVIVERFIPGVDHRLLVVGSRMVAASRGEPAVIVGDGKQTVRALIEVQLNSDPRRGTRDTAPWAKIETSDWDPTLVSDLQRQGHDITTVPRKGERVLVSRFANPSQDVTDDVHPSVSEHAVIAAKTAGLDICGVDVVCRDIGRPLEQQGGAVVEINASPGLHIHLEPAIGKGRPVGGAIIDMVFPPGNNGRIPVIGVTGTSGKTTTVRFTSHLLRAAGKFLGVSSSDGLQLGSRSTSSVQGERREGAQGVLLHPWTEVAICEASAEGILSEGLGFDRCQIGVVLNVGADDSGLVQINTLEEMARVKRCVVDSVLPDGVAILNADDEWVAAMAEHCKGTVIYFSREPAHAVVIAHRAQGGRAVLLRDGGIYLAEGAAERRLCASAQIQMPLSSHRRARLDSLLAAVAAAWAFGLADTSISEAAFDLIASI